MYEILFCELQMTADISMKGFYSILSFCIDQSIRYVAINIDVKHQTIASQSIHLSILLEAILCE